ncbi:hypothetical protein ACS0TY_027404 [Phlomoides rotata]
MADSFRCFWGLSLSLSLYLMQPISTTSHVYIVYLGHIHKNHTHDPFLTSDFHLQLLTNVFHSKEEANQAMLYSYKHTFSGFAATLNASQAAVLKNTRGVISVFESKVLQLHTTRSWDFMGLTLDYTHGTPLQLSHGDDVVVGILDTGVWPDSASFAEEPGMGPAPKNWKGKCNAGKEFNPKKECNKKLIGARYYLKGFEGRYGKIKSHEEYKSARDFLGHGTHTASTAVGSRAKHATLFGFAGGIARGGAPRARLAVYKVCWSKDFDGICTEEDVLAAFDEALSDGVHVISASFGKSPPLRAFFGSSADIGSFHAMQLGVSVVFSGGNDGPELSSVGNVNPWSICVAASDMDRRFPTKILVDRTTFFVGEGLITNHIIGVLANAKYYFSGGICNTRNWKNVSLSGMVLVCFSNDGDQVVKSEDAEYVARRAKAAALIFVQPLTRPVAALSIIPLLRIDSIQGTKLLLLPNCTKVEIFPSETALKRSSPAPMVSDFSSRGPSSISPDFLKPDISAPGINILAAWSPNAPPSVFTDDNRSVHWNLISGTSMSCPHVSGIVALLKSAHPHWSPAAIRSALITTAYNIDMNGDGILVEASQKSSDPFDIGSGHVNPVQAFDPGLIYDMKTRDYIVFLCNNGYSEEEIEALCGESSRCPERHELADWNINYPSITVSDLKCTTTVKRTLRNVGRIKTTIYFASIVNPNGVDVFVWPKILFFSPLREQVTYYLTLKPLKISQGRYGFGSITWSDGFHKVRSPLVVQVNNGGGEEEESHDQHGFMNM